MSHEPLSAVPPPLFRADRICKSYHTATQAEVHGLVDISLEIPESSCVAFAGPSGSGKSTLLAILSGLDKPNRGKIFFRGHELTACSDVELARVRRQLGFIFQDFALVPSLPVWENVSYPLVPRGIGRTARCRLARSLLDQFGVGETYLKRPGELSGGEQQRVAVARALVAEPDVIVADEPTSNLDAASTDALIAIFRSMRAMGKSIVFSSHDPRLLELADTVYELRAGRLAPF